MTDFEFEKMFGEMLEVQYNQLNKPILPSSYEELLEERQRVAQEIREIHDANLPEEELETKMYTLDRYMEDIEDTIFIIEESREV